ncbi:hypothetical protein [Streptomyces sp. LUP30]|uniref:hypothetical protein n=1 Tax=Streptomyces sp. LUP30 TaxID=1890285 RepID=UPI00210C9706|nr:hypothetical protein [Streptomyces sp. LUP30]
MELNCPACPARRHRGHYLCSACWRALPATTRGRLSRRDPHAFRRLRELHGQIAARVPLAVIRVSR